jgi:hypothetical protein
MCPDTFNLLVTVERILYRHWQQFTINVWAETVGESLVIRMFCLIDLQATTTEISSYMICQSYWKMYRWQSTRVVHA